MCLQISAKGMYAVNYESGGMVVGMKGFYPSPEGQLRSTYGRHAYKFNKDGFVKQSNQEQRVHLALMTPTGIVSSYVRMHLGYHVHKITQGFVLGGLGTVGLVEFPPHAIQLVGEDLVVSTFRLVNPEHIDHLVDQLVDLEVDIDGIRRRQSVLWKYAGWTKQED